MSGWLSLAITVILVLVAYLVLNRNINSRTSQQAALEEIKREVGAIITELNQTTERNVEIIEDRIETLERLIGQADKRLGALRRDLSSRQSEEVTYSRLGVDSSRGAGSTFTGTRQSDVDVPRSTGDSAAVSSSPDAGASHSSSGTGDGSVSAQPSVRERVRALYLQGLSLERIASIVGRTVGEVELIVSLEEG